MKQTLIILSIAAAGYYVARKYNLSQKVSFEFINVDFNGGFLSSSLTLNINVVNPTSATVTVKNLIGDVFFNGVHVGTCNMVDAAFIAAKTKTPISLNCQLKSLAVVTTIIAAISQKLGVFKFKGSVTADGIRLPVNFEYNL